MLAKLAQILQIEMTDALCDLLNEAYSDFFDAQ